MPALPTVSRRAVLCAAVSLAVLGPTFAAPAPQWATHADYVKRFVSSQHSCTVFDVSATELTLTQIGETGEILDTIRVTK